MSQMISTVPSVSARRPAATPSLVAGAANLARTIAAEWQVRRALVAMEGLDDRGLADIGICRGQAEGAVRFGRSGAPSAAAGRSAAESRSLMPMSFTEWR